MIHVIAKGRKLGTVRHARCDRDGNFCLRYLPQDDYQFYAHDSLAGWCTFPDVTVEDNSHDLATQTMRGGGTINAILPIGMRSDENYSIVATHENGMSVDALTSGDPQLSDREFSQLWPGVWTISLRKGESLVATRQVNLKEKTTAEVVFDE